MSEERKLPEMYYVALRMYEEHQKHHWHLDAVDKVHEEYPHISRATLEGIWLGINITKNPYPAD